MSSRWGVVPVVLSMGKETGMVVSIIEELLSADAAKKFLKSSRVGSKAFVIQSRANRFGSYLVVGAPSSYLRGRQRLV
jgi:hypothetical protein